MLRRLYWPINVALVVAVLTCPLAWYVSATSGYRSVQNRLNDSPFRLKAEERCRLEIHKFVYTGTTGDMTYVCRECGLRKRTSINNLLSRQ